MVKKKAPKQSKIPDFSLTVKKTPTDPAEDDCSGHESTKKGQLRKFLKQDCLVYTKTSNKIICSSLQIKFPDFSLTLNRDLETP